MYELDLSEQLHLCLWHRYQQIVNSCTLISDACTQSDCPYPAAFRRETLARRRYRGCRLPYNPQELPHRNARGRGLPNSSTRIKFGSAGVPISCCGYQRRWSSLVLPASGASNSIPSRDRLGHGQPRLCACRRLIPLLCYRGGRWSIWLST